MFYVLFQQIPHKDTVNSFDNIRQGTAANRRTYAAAALALIFSIVCRIPAHTDRSVNTSTMLP